MVRVYSTMLPLFTSVPSFALPDAVGGEVIRPEDFADSKGLLVAFLCNHCPFVKHIQEGFALFAREVQARGIAVVGINSNDVEQVPEDRPEAMREEAKRLGYSFPYLFDESQEIAMEFRAACTPEFYLFDRSRRLVYRGQFDESRPGNDIPVTGEDLRGAVDALLMGAPMVYDQHPSLGCNIKWKPGNEPDYFVPPPPKPPVAEEDEE